MPRRAAAPTPQQPHQRPRAAPREPQAVQGVSEARTATADALSAVYAAMTEAQLQRSIREYLTSRGYRVWVFPIMKRTMAGVPDLTFWHSQRPGVLHCWELKTVKGRIQPAQQIAINHLSTVPGIDARIVRPSEWPALRDELEIDSRAADAPRAGGRGRECDGR